MKRLAPGQSVWITHNVEKTWRNRSEWDDIDAGKLTLGRKYGIPGFATGGDFTVGGTGGLDSQRVSFMATPGEKVSVTTPGRSTGQADANVSYNLEFNVTISGQTDPDSFVEAIRQRLRTNPALLTAGLTRPG